MNRSLRSSSPGSRDGAGSAAERSAAAAAASVNAALTHAAAMAVRALVATLFFSPALAAAQAAAPLPTDDPESIGVLPRALLVELARARIPVSALALVVGDVAAAAPLLALNPNRPVNPASVFKLATGFAALEMLGPGYAWHTPIWIVGKLNKGVLTGTLTIKGSGDPSLSADRVRALMRRVRSFGVREVRGDIVIDRSLFARSSAAPADFDDEPLRPHNVQPDALLLAYRSVVHTFTPDTAAGVARIATDPELDGVRADTEVALADGPCGDWRATLKADLAQPLRHRFDGSYAASCGERAWPVAYVDPAQFDSRLLRAVWRELGGKFNGKVRDGRAPAGVAPSFEVVSPPLADVFHDLAKYSNNVMAQQLFMTLGLRGPSPGTSASARAVLQRWLVDHLGELGAGLVVDNGSGLSRETRISAAAMAALLRQIWASPLMPELISALPISGIDGTLRSSQGAPGRAHLKTGTLRDVAAIAGFVLTRQGHQRLLVAVVEHANAAAARPALDALVNAVAQDDQNR